MFYLFLRVFLLISNYKYTLRVECRTPVDKADHRLRNYSHVMPRILASVARKLFDQSCVILFGAAMRMTTSKPRPRSAMHRWCTRMKMKALKMDWVTRRPMHK